MKVVGGFKVFENKQEETAYMRQWIADHPGPWVRCPTCLSFRQSKTKPKPTDRCAQCREMVKKSDPLMPDRKPGTEHLRGSRDRRDWANYH